jgi:hypothetical protein
MTSPLFAKVDERSPSIASHESIIYECNELLLFFWKFILITNSNNYFVVIFF